MNANRPTMLPWITKLVRIGLGVIFVYASLGKIADPSAFATVVDNYRLLPASLITLTAAWIPWLEALCGLALVFGRLEKGAALLVSLLLLGFIAITLYNGYRGLDIACGCFSLNAKEPSNITLNTLRNLLLLGAGAWVMFSRDRWPSSAGMQPQKVAGG